MAAINCVFILSVLGITTAFLDQSSRSYPPPSFPWITKTDTTPYMHVKYVTESGYSGTFASPNYPGNYPNNALYVYDIGQTYFPTRLIFSSFDLEYCPACECDNVTIVPKNTAEQARVLCGSTLPNGNGVLDFSGPVEVRFASNSVYTSPGFQARYEIGQQPTDTTPPPSSRCPSPRCLSCRPGYVNHYNYHFNCPRCECIPEIISSAATSACPPVMCPTCSFKYEPRITYGSNCPECRCVYVSTSVSFPPVSTWPPVTASAWPPASASTWPPVPASTYPPPRGILSELFRIHGELSDLQDKAKQIDNDVIDIIQQLEDVVTTFRPILNDVLFCLMSLTIDRVKIKHSMKSVRNLSQFGPNKKF